jgi:hypothetical protein
MNKEPSNCHNAEPKPYNTATLMDDLYCENCGWPAIHVCCNDEMAMQEPYKVNDYWCYCSNKGCINHGGEEWNMSEPEFYFRSDARKNL